MIRADKLADGQCGIASCQGNCALEIDHAAPLQKAAPGALLFAKQATLSANSELEEQLVGGVALICLPSLAAELTNRTDIALLVTDTPRLSFMKLVNSHFPPKRPTPGVHESANIEPDAVIDTSASIGAFCFIGPACTIGARSILHPNVTIYGHTTIGENVIVHSGAVIGADGFGYEKRDDGGLEKFPHLGGVVIEDNVEIGSNTSIDRGSLGDTRLRQGCKIDNQIHIAHNVDVGEDAVIIAQSMIGGSVKIGPRAWIAPSVTIMNQVSIGADALVGLGSVVPKSVAEKQIVMGSPALPIEKFRALRAAMKSIVEEKE